MKLVELCWFLVCLALVPWLVLGWMICNLTPLEWFLLLVIVIGALTR